MVRTARKATRKSASVSSSGASEWRSWKLKLWWTTTVLVADMCIMATIIALERLSRGSTGLMAVKTVPAATLSHFSLENAVWSYGLLWTFLPALLLNLYRMAWSTIVTSTAERQPFIELSRPRPETNVRRTIMLDYRTYPGLYNWIVAFHYKHWLLGVAMLFNLVVSIALVPLTARLFATSVTSVPTPITIQRTKAYNESAFTSRTSLRPNFGIAEAARIYGGVPPPWMTTEYAFEPFHTTEQMSSGRTSSDVNAYSAYLDCRVLSTADYSTVSDGQNVVIKLTDRDCSRDDIAIPIGEQSQLLTQTWSTLQCSAEVGASRLGIVSGKYSPYSVSNLTQLSVVSCIPQYWVTAGALTVELESGQEPSYVSFNTRNATSGRPFYSKDLENSLPEYQIFDPTNTQRMDNFGQLVYSHALAHLPEDPLRSDAVLNATEIMFTAVHASMATTTLLQTVSDLPSTQSTAFITETRLFVVTPIAYTLVAMLACTMLCNIGLVWYAETHHSMLFGEEPIGLLGYAKLLLGSNIFTDLIGHSRVDKADSKLRKAIKKDYTWRESNCYYDGHRGTIQVEGLNRRTSPEPTLWQRVRGRFSKSPDAATKAPVVALAAPQQV